MKKSLLKMEYYIAGYNLINGLLIFIVAMCGLININSMWWCGQLYNYKFHIMGMFLALPFFISALMIFCSNKYNFMSTIINSIIQIIYYLLTIIFSYINGVKSQNLIYNLLIIQIFILIYFIKSFKKIRTKNLFQTK